MEMPSYHLLQKYLALYLCGMVYLLDAFQEESIMFPFSEGPALEILYGL